MSADTQPGRLARNTLFNMLGLGLPVLVALWSMPLLVRGLDAAGFGLIALAWVVHAYANELGFGRATTKLAAELVGGDDARLASVVWSTLALQTALGVCGGAALLVAAPLLVQNVLRVPTELHAEAHRSLVFLAATVPIVVAAAALRGLLEALQRFDLVNAVRGATSAAMFGLPIAGLAGGANVSGLIGLLLLPRLGSLVAYAGLAVWLVPSLARPTLTRADLRNVGSFGGWTSVSSVVSPLLLYIDRFMVGGLVSIAAVAYYTVPYELVVRLLIVPGSLVAALFPELSRLYGRGDAGRVTALSARAVRYTLLTTGPAAVLLIASAPDLLREWLGLEYALASSAALQILAFGIVINSVAHVPLTLLQGAGRPEIPARFHLAQLPVHLLVAGLLISTWGVAGAAAAWTARVALDASLLFWAAARVVPGSADGLRAQRVPALAALLAVCGLTALMLSQLHPAWGRAAGAVLVLLALLCVAWRVGMRSEDRQWITRLIMPLRSSNA